MASLPFSGIRCVAIRRHSLGTVVLGVLSTISAVTTPLFILGSVWVVLRGTRALRRTSAWIATFAFVVNAQWYALFSLDRQGLRIGFFLWWFSFLLMALGLFKLSGETANHAPMPSPKL